MSRLSAITYAPLIGRDVTMERVTSAEEQFRGDPPVIGMRGLIAGVKDTLDGVDIITDESLTFLIRPGDEVLWRFTIRDPESGEFIR